MVSYTDYGVLDQIVLTTYINWYLGGETWLVQYPDFVLNLTPSLL